MTCFAMTKFSLESVLKKHPPFSGRIREDVCSFLLGKIDFSWWKGMRKWLELRPKLPKEADVVFGK